MGESRSETEPQPRGRQESSRAAERAQEAAKGGGDLPGDKNLEPASERKVVLRARLQDKDQGAWTPRGEQRKEAKEPPEVGSCRLREVKILTRVGNRSTEEKTSVVTSSLEQQVSRSGWDTRPRGEKSWVLGGPEKDTAQKYQEGDGTCRILRKVFLRAAKHKVVDRVPPPPSPPWCVLS